MPARCGKEGAMVEGGAGVLLWLGPLSEKPF